LALARASRLGLAFVVLAMMLPWPPETPVLAAPAQAIAGLHVSGNQILNGNGQPVRLRGVNRTSGEYGCIFNFAIFEGPTNATAIQAMLNWKINAVRIPLNEDCWLDVNTSGIDRQYVDANYRATVTDYVSRLTAAGIVVILDLHWAAPGTQKATGQTPMADRDHSPAFWTSVATTFKSNTAVIFDLFNEPYPDGNTDTTAAWTCLRDGSTGGGSCPQVGYTAAGMQELLNAVRATGATNLVLVAGVAYTGVLSHWMQYKPADSLNPPNLAASVHIYPPGSQCSTVTCWNQQLAPIAAQYPIVAGETGQSNCAHDRLDTVIDWMEAKQQNYLIWAWWTEPCGASAYYGLITDYLTGAPSQGYGQGYKDRLAALVDAPPMTPGPTPTVGFTTAAAAVPSSVAPGGTVAITASVTSATAGHYVVDVEVHDAAEHLVYQQYFEDQAFTAGQARSFPVSWSVPPGTAMGTYTVQIGIFSAGWATDYTWDSYAAYVAVGASSATATPTAVATSTTVPTATASPAVPTPTLTPVTDCTIRPQVAVVTRPLGGGRLEATVRAQTLPGVPNNILERLTFTGVQNGSIAMGGRPVAVGVPASLNRGASVTFLLTRQQAGQSSLASFTVVDRCGEWKSFVGGGPDAF
jgi:hypothetical protein